MENTAGRSRSHFSRGAERGLLMMKMQFHAGVQQRLGPAVVLFAVCCIFLKDRLLFSSSWSWNGINDQHVRSSSCRRCENIHVF